MATATPYRRPCPHCGLPVHETNERDGVMFYACERCGTVGADAGPLQAARLSSERANARLQRAAQLLAKTNERIGKD